MNQGRDLGNGTTDRWPMLQGSWRRSAKRRQRHLLILRRLIGHARTGAGWSRGSGTKHARATIANATFIMKFAEFQAQVAEDIGRAMREGLPALYASLEAEIKVDLATPVGFAVMEREMAQRVDQEVYRLMSEWMLRTAASAPEICPDCDQALNQVTREMKREVALKTGKVKVRRSVGWCRGCERWRCPADAALKLPEITGHEEAENY